MIARNRPLLQLDGLHAILGSGPMSGALIASRWCKQDKSASLRRLHDDSLGYKHVYNRLAKML